MRLSLHATATARLISRRLLLAALLSGTAIAGLQSTHDAEHRAAVTTASVTHSDAAPGARGGSGHGHGSGPAAAHDSGTAALPGGAMDADAHMAMVLQSGQTDGPSLPTNRTATQDAQAATSGGDGLRHWSRDTALALPVVLAGLLAGAALARRVPGRTRHPRLIAGTGRTLGVSGALALASPAHLWLFGEGEATATGVARVLGSAVLLTAGALLMIAAVGAVAAAVGQLVRVPVRRPAAVGLSVVAALLAASGSVTATASAAPPPTSTAPALLLLLLLLRGPRPARPALGRSPTTCRPSRWPSRSTAGETRSRTACPTP